MGNITCNVSLNGMGNKMFSLDLSAVSIGVVSLFFALGIALLVIGAHWFVEGAVAVSVRLRISKLIIGSVVMSLATTSPELMVSLTAASQGNIWIALGSVFGSYIANIGLVLGVAGLIRPIKVSYIVLHRQLPFSIGALFVLVVLSAGAYFEATEALILLLLLAPWFAWLFFYAPQDDSAFTLPEEHRLWVSLFKFIGGFVFLQVGATVLVASAESIAISMGVSTYAVGLTIVAVGTSLPELASAVIGARKGEFELVLGNVLGANILLLLLVLPLSTLLSVKPVSFSDVWGDYFFMGLLSICLWLFSTRFDRSWQINRIEASILLSIFVLFQIYVYQ